MPTTAKPSPPATQLALVQPPRSSLSWEAMPIHHRQQVEQPLARMLRDRRAAPSRDTGSGGTR